MRGHVLRLPTAHCFFILTSAVESWGYRFSSECVAEVAAQTLTAEIPSYATIMELDRKVREFRIPEHAANVATSVAAPVPTIPADDLEIAVSMGRFVMAHAREVSKSRSLDVPDEQSPIMVSRTSLALYTSKFLRTGHHGKPRQSPQESIRAIIPRHLSSLFDYTAHHRSTVRHLSPSL